MLLAATVVPWSALHAQDAARVLAGPGATSNVLASDAEDKPDVLDVDEQAGFAAWKAGIKDQLGLDFGVDYNGLGYTATNSLGDHNSASGAFRVFGSWELIRRGTPANGSVVFKVENRHAFTDVSPQAFGSQLGYAGYPSSSFSDQDWRVTHLFLQQRFAEGRGVAYAGFLDVTDYVDVYELASPWTAFSNAAFQNGSGTIGGEPDGALGAMLGGFLSEHFYVVGGIADANGDPTDIGSGFDTFFNEFETFKSIEFGWTPGQGRFLVHNAHVGFWQIDERKAAGIPDGWGVNLSTDRLVDDAWLLFLRGGWSDGGGSNYEASISAGFGYTPRPGQGRLGLGVNWSRPNKTTFGARLDDQYTVEVFQWLQLTEGTEITPSIQYIRNPALNPSDESTLLIGLRFRIAI